MKLVNYLIIFMLVYACDCKKNVQSLTDSTGHDVIEIGTPVKELPPGVEEEPSAEAEEEPTTDETTRLTSKTTSKEARRAIDLKSRVATTTLKPLKDKDDSEETSSQEEEEARIEKELAEIYKDTDYKSESAEVPPKEVNVTETEEIVKPVARSRTNFKFQPDVNSRQDIERFRTSVDEISCERRVTQRLKNQACPTTGSKLKMRVLQFAALVLSLSLLH